MRDGSDLLTAFGALAIAAGFDARMAELASRNSVAFDPSLPTSHFLRDLVVAVRAGGRWRFYDPSVKYLPPDMLPWHYQGVTALVSDPHEPILAKTPVSGMERSSTSNTGKFRLAEDGSLEGDVVTSYAGLAAVSNQPSEGGSRGSILGAEGKSGSEEAFRRALSSRMPSAEVSGVSIISETESSKPIEYSYHLRIPGYATRTDKGLSVAPAVFQRGISARLSQQERRYDVCFDYPWSESDNITIDLPSGYAPDSAGMQTPIGMGRNGDYQAQMSIAKVLGSTRLVYSRRFAFGGIRVPVAQYSALKSTFDAIHEADAYTVTLR
jgi:hypothetical protein